MVRNTRLAEEKDVLAILDICERHHSSVSFSALPFSRSKVYKLIIDTLHGDPSTAILLVSEDKNRIVGAFLAIKSEITFSEVPVASELAFWVLPGYRKSRRVLDLVTAYEYWAKHIAKVDYAILSKTPLVDETERSYRRLGYRLVETNYLKKLG